VIYFEILKSLRGSRRMKKDNYIAIFDSGLGGFTALMEAVKMFPYENFLFYADTANVPYGEKSKNTVRELTLKSIKDISSYGVKAVIIACNTATSAVGEELRGNYPFTVLGMEPAIKPALIETQNNKKSDRVLLLSTLLTMKGEKLSRLIESIDINKRVDCMPLPGLVEFAEKMEFSGREVEKYIEEQILQRKLDQYGAIVLGCTHFIWYKELLEKMLPAHIKIFDGNHGTLMLLQKILKDSDLLSEKENKDREILIHFTNGINDEKKETLERKLGLSVQVI
jgi:glutamate racemase